MAQLSPIAERNQRHDKKEAHGDAVRAMFDRIAPTYDALNHIMSAGIDRRWRARAVAAIGDAPLGPVLDLCAGTMDLTALISRAYPDRRVGAADFAAEMLERGKNKAPSAERVVADAMNLPFDAGSFAAVVCGFGIRNVADVATVAREVRRVLAPAGVFVTLELFRPARGVTRLFHEAYAKHVLPAVGGLISGDRAAYDYLARSMRGFFTREEYEAVLRQAGFEGVRGEDQTLGISAIVSSSVPR